MDRLSRLLSAGFIAFAIAQFPADALGQSPLAQIQLSETQVESFISAHKELSAAVEKLRPDGSDKPDPNVQAQLESVAKKHGFKNFNEYDDVAANIALIMAGIDPVTKGFTDPPQQIQQEIELVRNDKTLTDQERKQALLELNEALKFAQPIKFPGNIDVVKKYYERLEKVLQ